MKHFGFPPPRIPRPVRLLLVVPLLAFGLASVLAPPVIVYALVRRGLAEGRAAWTVLGALIGLLWLLLVAAMLRRALRHPSA